MYTSALFVLLLLLLLPSSLSPCWIIEMPSDETSDIKKPISSLDRAIYLSPYSLTHIIKSGGLARRLCHVDTAWAVQPPGHTSTRARPHTHTVEGKHKTVRFTARGESFRLAADGFIHGPSLCLLAVRSHPRTQAHALPLWSVSHSYHIISLLIKMELGLLNHFNRLPLFPRYAIKKNSLFFFDFLRKSNKICGIRGIFHVALGLRTGGLCDKINFFLVSRWMTSSNWCDWVAD